MKYMKMLGLLVFAAAALTVLTGTASATTLTSPAGTALGVGTEIKAESGATAFDAIVNSTCQNSTFEGKVTNVGGGTPTQNVSGEISKLTFSECGTTTVTVLNEGGAFDLERIGGGKGTLRWSGLEMTWLTHSLLFGTMHCIYVFQGAHVGTFTGGSPAQHSTNSAPIPIGEEGGFCGATMEWTGVYTFTQPNPLLID